MTRKIPSLSFATGHTAGLAFFLLGLLTNPAFSASSIQLTWNANSEPDLMGYYVHMGTSPSSYNTRENAGLVPSYTFKNLPEGITYYFTVTAYDQSGNVSEPAKEVSIALPIHNTNPSPPRSQDLNGDGKADLVWHNTKTGQVAVWLLNGTSVTTSGFLGQLPTEWALSGVDDLNGDDKADVLWRNDTNGAVAAWLMNGLTITSTGFPGSASTAWAIQGIGDVNGDGKADLIWRNTTDGNTAIWIMNGAAIAATGFPAGVPLEWQIAGVGDVNGDGKADVIWRHDTSGTMAIWLMNGLTISSTAFPGSAPTTWTIQAVGDVNGDGKADLVWHNIT
ncbi:MAG TPA: FG-GAP-like repeat-containing protein, partial [Nitrospirales bacterium]|nr:FG-GAP-like repeat-containing protein [Nitrospirales bacterium]